MADGLPGVKQIEIGLPRRLSPYFQGFSKVAKGIDEKDS
jgi:hypothetical protein